MRWSKEIFVAGFALFSMFFGAGNLILPVTLGFKAGTSWYLVFFGFALSAVIIPLLGIFAHARLQGTMLDFGKKISPLFSLLYCMIVYVISITLPSPRTAAVTHEMAIAPFSEINSLTTSCIYFLLVLIFVLNRSRVLDFIGKFLTPLILLVILSIIGIGVFSTETIASDASLTTPFISGLLEGYQTYDAIGAVVVGGVLIVSLRLKGEHDYAKNKRLLVKAGIVAGISLFIVYAGMIYNGALLMNDFKIDSSHTELLYELSYQTIRAVGSLFLSVLIALACFTTAVGIVTGTADFIKGVYHNSLLLYRITAVIGCLLGVVMGQLPVSVILSVGVPALLLIYPVTILLILLNVLPENTTTPATCRLVIIVGVLFSIPDCITSIINSESIAVMSEWIPLSSYKLGWVFPSVIVYILANTHRFLKKNHTV